MIITTFRELQQHYPQLGPGDIFIGHIPSGRQRPILLMDLVQRGIRCLPSGTARLLNGSKSAQAVLLKAYMHPHTRAIWRRTDLIATVNDYNALAIGPVISKEDRMHCGHGIRCWESIETLYSHLALSDGAYPFVVQPLLRDFTDVRVIVVGDYVEAYQRYNPGNLRQNLSVGGEHRPVVLGDRMERFCREIMARGGFPFAHIDILLMQDGTPYLSEIALNAGGKGSCIGSEQLAQKKKRLIRRIIDDKKPAEPLHTHIDNSFLKEVVFEYGKSNEK